MLKAEHVSIGFGKKVLAEGIELSLAPGQIKGLIAPNGTGKTTLLRFLAGNKHLGKGAVEVDGASIWARAMPARSTAYVPGDGSLLYNNLSALEHLKLVQDVWATAFDMKAIVRTCCLEHFATRAAGKLSQGMRQAVSLALGYATGASYLLLDEPMNALDPTNIDAHSRVMKRLAAQGVAILYSSHLLENVGELCDAVYTLHSDGLREHVNPQKPGFVQELYRRSYPT